ncbi:uncharacterized protein ARMOST_21775 [Armillaria ostoyae]|uniref:Uncharacterized protein n=1 Tax=Armillaria ostoyae TaxID=47428 RepID=A0A284SB01_ARMOS|nr:uncharacterized protein ARMOST_21775 [Armillaria ostoyae]
MLLSLLLPTAMAYIVRFENHCGSGSPSVILEDGTRVDGVNSYESSVSGIVSVFLDQGTGDQYASRLEFHAKCY